MIKIFTIYDTIAKAFLQPMFQPTTGAMLRLWSDSMKDPKSQFAAHPGDYIMYEIGTYDEFTGTISPLSTPVNLGPASQFLPENHQSEAKALNPNTRYAEMIRNADLGVPPNNSRPETLTAKDLQ